MEPWAPAMQSPYLIGPDDMPDEHLARLVEDGPSSLEFHDGSGEFNGEVAFVDGVRRAEAYLYFSEGNNLSVGIVGSHGVGAVVTGHGDWLSFERCEIKRIVIWGNGKTAQLPGQPGGWVWSTHSIASAEPEAPLSELQIRMRNAEGALAELLCGDGFLTVVDGPLNFVRSRDLPVIGYVKTHSRRRLPEDLHARVPLLGPGQRTSLFFPRPDIYSCYMRLTESSAIAGPWSGIVRLEFPASTGLSDVRTQASQATAVLPRYCGLMHVDPRAPQNLQPIGSLEHHLRHLLGDGGLAERAVRDAIVSLQSQEGATGE